MEIANVRKLISTLQLEITNKQKAQAKKKKSKLYIYIININLKKYLLNYKYIILLL